jgi:hypothetical protein
MVTFAILWWRSASNVGLSPSVILIAVVPLHHCTPELAPALYFVDNPSSSLSTNQPVVLHIFRDPATSIHARILIGYRPLPLVTTRTCRIHAPARRQSVGFAVDQHPQRVLGVPLRSDTLLAGDTFVNDTIQRLAATPNRSEDVLSKETGLTPFATTSSALQTRVRSTPLITP